MNMQECDQYLWDEAEREQVKTWIHEVARRLPCLPEDPANSQVTPTCPQNPR